ncbi:MAG: glycoside hydrolase TIM-barrel-like domain-containing protein, partial [Hyphomicrobium sp.]
MATLALAAAGAAIGSTLLPTGVTFLGATLTGAAIGSQIGSLAGSYIDNALFGPSGQTRAVEGPRLTNLHVTASTEGAPIPRLYGRARLGGQVIWATGFEEEVVTSSQSAGGGKGGALGGGGAEVSTTEYRYYANLAVALCEGPITQIGRVWADGREIDLSGYTWRLHLGGEAEAVDSLIAAREGAGNAPAYRGLAYIVFERLALAEFGNRVPQFSFEVFRNTDASDADIKALVVIPGSGEFVYATEPVRQIFDEGAAAGMNIHTLQGPTDWDVAIDQMQAALPNAKQISLVVSWFGSDLRAGNCQFKPGIEAVNKVTEPVSWSVAGQTRANGYLVSQIDGRAAYGGTPSDQTVIAAIRDMTARGLNVTMTPFVLMDIAAGNTLPNPYSGASQPAYPWRGRITCHPAAGQPGSVDKTAAALTQITSLIGTVSPAHFTLNGDTVVYSGPPNEWSYRRMILHNAYLAKAAGGVEAFQIGSELRGLTGVRSNANTFPFVAALIALATDVKAILGPAVKVIYAADWSEYFGYQPGDGTGDVYFHLDPLWASSSIDAVGIDVYWPLADWREGRAHLDYQA